jgi:hypothetical protein
VVFSVEVNTMHINHRRKNKKKKTTCLLPYDQLPAYKQARTCKGCKGSPQQRLTIKKQLSKKFRKLNRLMVTSETPPLFRKTLLWELF